MSRIYNTIGSLKTLKEHLEESNIYDFKSLKEVIDFQSTFVASRQQLISHHKNLIEEEKKKLKIELKSLGREIELKKSQTVKILTDEIDKLKHLYDIYKSHIPTNLFQKIANNLRLWNHSRKIKNKENKFDSEVKKTISYLVGSFKEKRKRYHYLTSNEDEAIKHIVSQSLSELERKKAVIDNLNSFIYGAIGEQKVVKAIENLSDHYFLINDFSVSFSPAIYNRHENDYIKSIQIDHILVAPSGVFLIETKNWSEKSLENLSLRSPVQQIRRASFVLFKLLNNEKSKYYLGLDGHHWGDKKISIKNLIVMINKKPQEEFQFVKVLTLNELLGYINYFKSTFSINETQRIADFLLQINEQKVIETK
jgi:hypothetical protein